MNIERKSWRILLLVDICCLPVYHFLFASPDPLSSIYLILDSLLRSPNLEMEFLISLIETEEKLNANMKERVYFQLFPFHEKLLWVEW